MSIGLNPESRTSGVVAERGEEAKHIGDRLRPVIGERSRLHVIEVVIPRDDGTRDPSEEKRRGGCQTDNAMHRG